MKHHPKEWEAALTVGALLWCGALFFVGAIAGQTGFVWFFAVTVWLVIAAVVIELLRGWVSACLARRRQRGRSRSSS